MFCCDELRTNVTSSQQSEWDDNLIYFTEKFDEYGIIIHDGGRSYILINYCPWCGTKLPESKRDLWFAILDQLGFDDPIEQDIPEDFKTAKWFTNGKYDELIKLKERQ